MSDDIIIIDDDFEMSPVAERPARRDNYEIILDIDDDADIPHNNNINVHNNTFTNNPRTSSSIIGNNDDEFLEIFGVGTMRKTTTTSANTITQIRIVPPTTSVPQMQQSISSSFHEKIHNDDDDFDIIEINDYMPVPTSNLAKSKTPSSELICVDDEDDNNNNDNFDIANSSNSRISITATNNANAYPLSSPTISRSFDIIEPTSTATKTQKRTHSSTSQETPAKKSKSTTTRKSTTARQRANLDPSIPPGLNISTSSIGPITQPIRKIQTVGTFDRFDAPVARVQNTVINRLHSSDDTADVIEKPKSKTVNPPAILRKVTNSKLNEKTKSKTKTAASLAQSSRARTNIFNTVHHRSSDLTDFSSSMNDIVLDNVKLVSNLELKEKTQALKDMRKKETTRVKDLKSQLKGIGSSREEIVNKYSKAANSTFVEKKLTKPAAAPFAVASDVDDDESIENTNSSAIIKKHNPREKFMDSATEDLALYSEERLEYMLDRAKQFDAEKLKKANRNNYTKDELTGRITCCFSNNLDEKLKVMNKDYGTHLEPAHFEVIDDILPIVRFKRYVDKILYEKKNTYVPVKPRQVFEEFVILIYHANDVIDMFTEGLFKKHLASVKKQYPDTRIAVWIIDYDAFLQKLKTNSNKVYKDRVHGKLASEAEDSETTSKSKKSKKKSDPINGIQPKHLKQKMLKYEVEYDFAFQSIKGIKDLIEWMKAIAYTLTCKHIDFLERSNGISAITKIKSGDNAKSCLVQMMCSSKFCSEKRAKSFVEEESYTCIGDLFDDVVVGNVLSHGSLRKDNEAFFKKLLTSRNENDVF